jgi:colanic acid biosynthesis protein WcaH
MIIPEPLYEQFCRCMPVACVDLIVVAPGGRVLLLLRQNDPASGQWWFPGGRVLHGETRYRAALRKLQQECGIPALSVEELGTHDVILDCPAKGFQHHGITTVFLVRVDGATAVALDAQSAAHAWRTPEEWRRLPLHAFVASGLARLEARRG